MADAAAAAQGASPLRVIALAAGLLALATGAWAQAPKRGPVPAGATGTPAAATKATTVPSPLPSTVAPRPGGEGGKAAAAPAASASAAASVATKPGAGEPGGAAASGLPLLMAPAALATGLAALPARDTALEAALATLERKRAAGEGPQDDGAGPGSLPLTEVQPVWQALRRLGSWWQVQAQRGVKAEPAGEPVLRALAQGALALGVDNHAALAAFRRAAEADAQEAWSRIAIGDLLARANDQIGALAAYQPALALVTTRYAQAQPGGTGPVPKPGVTLAASAPSATPPIGVAGSGAPAGTVLTASTGMASMSSAGAGEAAAPRPQPAPPRGAEAIGLAHVLAVLELRVAEMLVATERNEEAAESFERAAGWTEALLQAQPALGDRVFEATSLSDRLATHLTLLGRWEAALQAQRRSLALGTALAAAAGNGPGADPEEASTWQFYLQGKHDAIADLQLQLGDGEGAMESYRTALAISDTLVERNVQNDDWLGGFLTLVLKVGSSSALPQSGEDRRQLLLHGLEMMSKVRSGAIWDAQDEWGDQLRAALDALPPPGED